MFVCLLLAVLCLRCCMQACSSCGEQGLLPWAPGHPGFSSPNTRAQVLPSRLQSAGSFLWHRLSCPAAGEIFPDQGLKPWSPPLAGRFLTMGHQGSPQMRKRHREVKYMRRKYDRQVWQPKSEAMPFSYLKFRQGATNTSEITIKNQNGEATTRTGGSPEIKNVSLKVESLRSSAFSFSFA